MKKINCNFEEVSNVLWHSTDKFSHLGKRFFLCFWSSYVIGDKSILQDVGVTDLKDIEALPPPPEIKDAQKYKGDVSYFICTKPGKGPVLLSDKNQALLSPETGLPK